MKAKRVLFKYRIENALFNTFIFMVKLSPIFLMKFHSKLIRFIFYKFAKRHHKIVEKNLNIAFPDFSSEKKLNLKQDIYTHFSTVIVQIITLFVKQKPKKIEKIFKPIEVKNIHFIRQALEKGKGVIIFSAHFGNWELTPFILNRELDLKINSIAREMNNPLVEQKVKRFREFMGSSVIYKQHSIRTILKRLAENEIVYLLVDQKTIDREAVMVNFFGKTVGCTFSAAQLHIKKEIPMVPVFLHYEPEKIVLEISQEISFPRTNDKENDIKQLTQHCISIIETKIKSYPDQWFWFHDRWKTCPSLGETPGEIKEEL